MRFEQKPYAFAGRARREASLTARCLTGSAMTFNTDGIDFAMTALFVVIFTEQLLQAEDYVPAVTGVAASLLSLLLFGPDRFLIPAMLAITTVLSAYSLKSTKKGGAA